MQKKKKTILIYRPHLQRLLLCLSVWSICHLKKKNTNLLRIKYSIDSSNLVILISFVVFILFNDVFVCACVMFISFLALLFLSLVFNERKKEEREQKYDED